MAELAGVVVRGTIQPQVVELAGEPLVQIKALVLLDAPLVDVELAELPHLRHVHLVREQALSVILQQNVRK